MIGDEPEETVMSLVVTPHLHEVLTWSDRIYDRDGG